MIHIQLLINQGLWSIYQSIFTVMLATFGFFRPFVQDKLYASIMKGHAAFLLYSSRGQHSKSIHNYKLYIDVTYRPTRALMKLLSLLKAVSQYLIKIALNGAVSNPRPRFNPCLPSGGITRLRLSQLRLRKPISTTILV